MLPNARQTMPSMLVCAFLVDTALQCLKEHHKRTYTNIFGGCSTIQCSRLVSTSLSNLVRGGHQCTFSGNCRLSVPISKALLGRQKPGFQAFCQGTVPVLQSSTLQQTTTVKAVTYAAVGAQHGRSPRQEERLPKSCAGYWLSINPTPCRNVCKQTRHVVKIIFVTGPSMQWWTKLLVPVTAAPSASSYLTQNPARQEPAGSRTTNRTD
jgi:hypothetical protein